MAREQLLAALTELKKPKKRRLQSGLKKQTSRLPPLPSPAAASRSHWNQVQFLPSTIVREVWEQFRGCNGVHSWTELWLLGGEPSFPQHFHVPVVFLCIFVHNDLTVGANIDADGKQSDERQGLGCHFSAFASGSEQGYPWGCRLPWNE